MPFPAAQHWVTAAATPERAAAHEICSSSSCVVCADHIATLLGETGPALSHGRPPLLGLGTKQERDLEPGLAVPQTFLCSPGVILALWSGAGGTGCSGRAGDRLTQVRWAASIPSAADRDTLNIADFLLSRSERGNEAGQFWGAGLYLTHSCPFLQEDVH